jgi:hypothetical protein
MMSKSADPTLVVRSTKWEKGRGTPPIRGRGRFVTRENALLLREFAGERWFGVCWQKCMAGMSPELREALGRENWQLLFEWAVAERQIGGLRWRGKRSGVLPRGYEATSIAAEAISEVFAGKCELAAGYEPEELKRGLERLIVRQVDRLRHLKENAVLRNEGDLTPLATTKDGDLRIREALDGKSTRPDQVAAEVEKRTELARFKRRARAMLGADRDAQGIFSCLCEGVVKRSAIGARLGMGRLAVKNARKRLERKLRKLVGNGDGEQSLVE